MSERRAGTKGRRMGSSRRKLLRESSAEAPAAAPSPGEESPWASEMMQKVQDFLKERDKDRAGFITRSDMEKLQEENFPCSREEMELIFDGLDAAGTGRLSTEEFTAGLWQFLSSQKTARHHRRSKMASRRVRLVIPSPVLEGADSEERRHFTAFMEQLGTDNISEEQEIWQLWVKLRQDEPQLLGNLEDFLAKMRHRIQEAKSKKEALELTLNKRVAEHDKEVQQLCQALEQQIQEEQQRLQQESVARGHQHDLELQQALDASEREVQRLVTAQKELEARCHSLHSTQQATSTENQQLEETNRVLEDHLQHLHQQLQETQERLQTARAAVAQGHAEEPRYRVVAELPSKTPLSPQSLEKSEVYHSEMRIRLGSQSTKTKTKSIHQVVWEMPPAEVSFLGPQLRASSTEEDPFPEFLKEEHFSDQSSLLREMNDAIAALNKKLKPQALDAPPALAEAAQKPWNDVEPQMGSEAATGHGIPPRVRQETLSSHIGHEMFEGDLKEGPATAELHVPDVTQAGASMGAGHHRAQELGAEQGETLEEAGGMLFLQGKGSGVKEPMPKAARDQQGAVGESMEAEERVLLEGEGEGWMEGKPGWEKARLLGEAEEGALYQGKKMEVGLGPPEAGEAGLGLSAAPEECVQPPRAGLGEEAGPPVRLSKEQEIHPGEHPEPEPPSLGEVRMGASQEDGVPKGTVAPGPGVLEEEHGSVELQPWGETLDAEVLPTQHGGSRGAGDEEGEVEITQPMEAELQPQGESARGEAGQGGSRGAEVLEEALELVGAEESQADTQLCGDPSPEAPRGGGDQAAMQLQVEDEDEGRGQGEHELPQEPLMVLHGTGLGQGDGSGAEEQPGAEADEFRTGRGGPAPLPVMTFGVQRAGVGVKGDGELPEEDGELELVQGEASKEEDGLILVKSQGLELAEAEDAQADRQLPGAASPEPPLAGEGPAVMQLVEEDEDEEGARGQGECELLHEPELDPQGEGAPEGVQPWEEAESLAVLGDQSTDANVQETREADKLSLTLGGGTEADLQPPSEAGYLDPEQGGSEAPDVQPLDQLDTPESVEKQEAEDAQEDTQLPGSPGPETLQGRGDHGAMQLVEEAGAGAQGQGECELLHEPELDLEGEGAPEGVQPWEEAESLAVLGDQSTDANVQETREADKLSLTLGGGTEADLQPPSEAGFLDPEQGGSEAPDVQPLDGLDTPESVEMREAEDSGQGECELLHEPELDPQGEGPGLDVQPWEEAVIQGVLGDQSTDANVSLLLEVDELKLSPGGDTEADLKPWSEQGASMAPDVQPLDQLDTPESVEKGEAEDAQADRQLPGGASPEPPLEGEGPAVMQLVEEAEEGAQGEGECELLHEAELGLEGEGAPEGVQPWEEAESLAVLGDQSTDANVQETRESDKLSLTLGGGTEADLQPSSEAGYLDPEQGGSEAPDVQALDQLDTPESVEKQEAEDAQEDTQLPGSPGPETLQGRGDHGAMQLVEEAGAGAQGQGECELLPEPELDLEGEGAPEGVQPWEEAESLAVLGDQSTDANVSLLLEVDELKLSPGGDTEADLKPWSEQGASMAPDVQPLDQLDAPESVEMREAEDSGQGECELLHEPELDPQGEGPGLDVQPWEEAVIQGVLGDQSTDANVSLLLELDELKSTPGGDTEAALQLWSEQGASMAPDVQPLDRLDTPESVEKQEAEDAQADRQLPGAASPEPPLAGEGPAVMQLVEEDEAEEGAGGQGECELLHEPELDPQGEGPGLDVQPWEEAESLAVLGDQSTDANVSLLLEVDELKSTPGGVTEAALKSRIEQGASMAPDVQPLDQLDTPESVEMREAEDAQADRQLPGGTRPETVQERGDHAAIWLLEETEDGEEGQAECELPHEPLDPQGEGSPDDVQPWEEAESLAVLGDQSTDANVSLLFEVNEIKSTLGRGTEADLQPPSEAGYLDPEQGGSEAPDVQPLDQLDTPESLEKGEAEDAQADRQLPGGASPEPPLAGEGPAVMQLVEEDEEGAGGQGECELLHEPELDPQGEGPGLDVQPWEEAVIQGVLGDQSTDANVSLLLEVDELKSSPGGDTEAALQLWSEQGASMAPDVQPLDRLDTPESVEKGEAEDAQADRQLPGAASPEPPLAGEGPAVMQLVEEDEDEEGARGQGECELLHEPELDPQGEGAPEGVQPWEEAESLAVLGDQSTDANVQETRESDKLSLTLGGGTEADLQPSSEAGYLDPEQGGSEAPDVQALDQLDTPESVEKQEAEDAQEDTQLPGSPGPETLQGRGDHGAMQLVEEAGAGAQGQGECELLHEPELGLEGEGAPEGVQPWEEAESLAVLGDQSTDANVQETREADKLSLTLGGGTEADLQPPSEAGYLDPEQGGSEAPDVQPLDGLDTPESVEMREAEDSGQGECELLHEPELDPQGEGPGLDVQPWEEAVIQGVLGDQSTDANVSLLLEVDELKLSPGGDTEAALQLWGEQGASMAPDVQPLDRLDTPESVEKGEAEDAQADRQLPGAASPEPPLAGEGPAVMQLVEEAEDGAQGQGECELLHEPELGLEGEGAPEGVQPWEEAESLAVLGDQSTDANVQETREADKLKSSPGGGTEADVLLPREAGFLDPEQGGSEAPGVQLLEEDDNQDLGLAEGGGAAVVCAEGPSPVQTPVGSPDPGGMFPVKAQALELVGAEESQADTQLCGDPSPEAPRGGGDQAAMQLQVEDEDEGRGQGEHELPQEPLMVLHGTGLGQGDGSGAEEQPGAEADEFRTGRGGPAPLPVMTFGVQRAGVGVKGDGELPEEDGELELVQGEASKEEDGLILVKSQGLELAEAEDAQADRQLPGAASPEPPLAGEGPAVMQLVEEDEAEEGAGGQGECELLHEPELGLEGEGAPEGVQPWEEAESLAVLGDQSTDATVQETREADKLSLTLGGGTEADLQPPSEAGYLDPEQGGSEAPDVQPLDQLDTPESVEKQEAEDAQEDTQLPGSPDPETLQGRGDHGAMQLVEEAGAGAQGQGECELLHEPELGLEGEGAPEGVQPWEEAESLAVLGDQSTDANVQETREADKLSLTLGGGTEADLQPPSEAGFLDPEQGGSEAPDVQPLDGLDTPESVEMREAEDSGQGECELLHEPELDPQGEGPGLDVQPWEEAVIQGVLGDQSTDANVSLLLEVDELKLSPGGDTEADLKPWSEQGASMAPDVQPLDQLDTPESVEKGEAEDAQADRQLPGGASPEPPLEGEGPAVMQLVEEAEEGAQGEGECELLHEAELGLEGEGAPEGVQPWEEAESLAVLGDQSTDANVQETREADKLSLTLGGGTEADLQPPSEAGYLDPEQGGSEAPDVQALDQLDTPESVEKQEAEDAQEDTQLPGSPGPETLQGRGDHGAMQLVEEAGAGAQGQGECELLPEPELDLEGEGAPEGVQPWEEAESLAVLGDQSTDANVSLLLEVDELKLSPGGDTEADLKPWSEQGASMAPDVQPLDQLDTPESVEMREAEDSGQGECELLHEPELDPQGEGPGLDVQPWEEAVIQGVLGDQSTDANVSLLLELDELKSTPGGDTEAALQLWSEQGASMAPDVQPLDQLDTPESVEKQEAEDAQADRQLPGAASPEPPLAGEGPAVMQLVEEDEAEEGAGGQGECELLHEPELDPQGEGAPEGVQPWEEAESLAVLGDQSTDANVSLLLEVDELKSTPGGVTEAALKSRIEQGASMAPDVQPLDQLDTPESVEMREAEDAQADRQLPGGTRPETVQGRGDHAAIWLLEETEDGEEGQAECELPHEPLDPQGEGSPDDVQPWEEAESLAVLGDQSTDANVSLLFEVNEIKSTLGGGTEADLQPPSEAGYLDPEQGGSEAPDVQPLDRLDTPESVEKGEAEDAQADRQLPGGASLEPPLAGEGPAVMQLVEEDEDGARGQRECELLHEPELDPQGEGPGLDVQPWEEAVIQAVLGDQSTDANVSLLLEVDELKSSPGGDTEAALQLWSEQGASMAPDVQPLDRLDTPESVEKGEAEDAQADRQLPGGASPEPPLAGEGPAVMQLVEEDEDGARGQGECELLPEPELDPQGEGPGLDVQPWEEAESLAVLGDQSTDGNVSLLLEVDELKSSPGGDTEAALKSQSEQGASMAPDVQPLDRLDNPESVEKGEAEDAQADRQLPGAASPEPPLAGEGPAVMQLVEEAEEGAGGQGECELLHEPELDPQEEGPGLDVQPWEEAVIQGMLADQSTDANVLLLLEVDELKSSPGGDTEAALQLWSEQGASMAPDVQPLDQLDTPESVEKQEAEDAQADRQLPGGASPESPLAGEGPAVMQLVEEAEDGADLAPLGPAGVQEGEQSPTPGLEAGLHAAHTADVWEGAAGAHVCPPPEATLHPDRVAEGPGLSMMLGALTGADGQIQEDAQTLEIPQAEGADAEDRPLDGAQALEAVQGGRLEAGVRSLVGTQALGIKHGHDEGGLPALAPLVSEAPLQTSTLQLMMQEDVLVPDAWQLGGSGQAAQSELQEQVSAQRDKVKLHTASQQPQEPPRVMEREQVAARPAEPPKQEVPPASTLHTRVQQEEGAENDQLGMVLRNSSLRDEAILTVQPQRQLPEEQSKDLHTGQQGKQQEVGWKMSHEGGSSPGVPGPVTAAGAEAGQRSSPEAFLDPDHLYNVLFVGDSHVGKTSFLYRLHADAFNPHLTATVGLDYQVKNLVVDNKCFSLRLWDSAGQERYRSITKQYFRKADGVVLMYDITSEYSFSDVRYWLTCIQEGAEDGVGILLLGNKTDRAAERRVPTEEGERLAKEHQLMFYECSAASGHNVSESMVSFIRLLKAREDELKNKVVEEPRPPQKKKGCC